MDDMNPQRITLNLDEDVLEGAREQAEKTGEPLGKIISRVARHGHFALKGPVVFPTLPPRPLERIVTTSFIKRLEYEADMEDAFGYPGQDEADLSSKSEHEP
jgi:hypothetical protein